MNMMQMTVSRLTEIRTDENFQMLFDDNVDSCQSLDIELPTVPLRFRGQATEHVWSNSTENYRAQYFCVIGAAVGALERRDNMS